MKRVALAVLCLAVAGCGAEGEAIECDAADGIVWNGVSYFAADIDPPRPPAGLPLDGGIRPDSYGGGQPVGLRAVQGLPADVAVYLARGDRVRVRGHGCGGKGMIPRRIEPRP